MFRSAIVTALLIGGGLFGYYFLTDRSGASATDRARSAVGQVGDLAKDTGEGLMVQARLTARWGMDAMKYVHVYYNDGAVIIYGLAPAHVKGDELSVAAREVPGVRTVEVLVQERPATMNPAP